MASVKTFQLDESASVILSGCKVISSVISGLENEIVVSKSHLLSVHCLNLICLSQIGFLKLFVIFSDWSKIYVGVIVCFLLLMKLSIIWSLVYLFRRNARVLRGSFNDKQESGFLNGSLRNGSKRHHGGGGSGGSSNHSKTKQYALLDDEDDEDELEMEIRGKMVLVNPHLIRRSWIGML